MEMDHSHNSLSEKEARHNKNKAHGAYRSLADRHIDSGKTRSALSRRFYNMGFFGAAKKIAPEEFARLEYIRRSNELQAILEDALEAAYDTPVSKDFPKGPYKPRSTAQESEPEKIIEEISPIQPVHEHVDTTKTPEKIFDWKKWDQWQEPTPQPLEENNEETIHWKEWEAWNYHDKTEENQVTENSSEYENAAPFQYFDENLKNVRLTKDTPTGYESHDQTNESIEHFLKEAAWKIGRKSWRDTLSDLQNVIQYTIANPFGPQAKKMHAATINVDGITHGLFRASPRDIPRQKFINSNTKTVRLIYFMDKNSLVIHEILTHKEMYKKYGTRNRD